jgi:hypothetical protein
VVQVVARGGIFILGICPSVSVAFRVGGCPASAATRTNTSPQSSRLTGKRPIKAVIEEHEITDEIQKKRLVALPEH